MGEQQPQPRSLKFRTIQLLRATQLTDRQIARDIGVSTPWVQLFRCGDIKSPNVDTVQRLYEYLSGKTLFNEET